MSAIPDNFLHGIPENIRNDLLLAYAEVVSRYNEERWEPSELNGGKFSEAAYAIVKAVADGGIYPASVQKPQRFDQACKDLEKADKTLPRSIRIGIPRVLIALYDIRNNRNVGHLGGDVNPNGMDASVVLAMVKWVVAEFVRIFHDTTPAEAQSMVELITERNIPVIWSVNDVKRVLIPGMKLKDQTLILLHQAQGPLNIKDLASWVEVRNISNYKRVIMPMHKDHLIEFNLKNDTVTLSPTGSREAEALLRKLK